MMEIKCTRGCLSCPSHMLVALVLALSLVSAACTAVPTGLENDRPERCACRYQQAIQAGGEWFLNNQNDNFLYYRYNFLSGEYSSTQDPLREMASLWAVTRLAKYLNDDRFTRLADWGFAYFEKHFMSDTPDGFYYVDMGTGDRNLGETAFIMLALLGMEHPQKDFYLEKFAQGVMSLQQPDGSFNTTNADSYPGEALLAMMSLYEYHPKPEYLACVRKAFSYYVDYFRSNRHAGFVPWQSRAYQKLYRATGDIAVAHFVFEMNDYVIQGYALRDPPGIVTAVYLEGVNKAYELARDVCDVVRQQAYAEFIRGGSDYILSLQLPYEPSLPLEAVGGFIVKKDSYSLQIDWNQHAVMALMDSCDLGLLGD